MRFLGSLLLWLGCVGQASAAIAPLRAYSEFMPPPQIGPRPYGPRPTGPSPGYQYPGHVSWFDELRVIRPGLESALRHWVGSWGPVEGGEWVALWVPVTLAKTKDDRGGTPWTLFGGAEGPPEPEFWRGQGEPAALASWLCGLLSPRGLTTCGNLEALASAGVAYFGSGAPRWVAPLLRASVAPKFLLTFEPPSKWPSSLRERFSAGDLTVVPHPKTLDPWNHGPWSRLAKRSSEGWQLPLAKVFSGAPEVPGFRVPKVHTLEIQETDRRLRRAVGRFPRNRAVPEEGGAEVSPFRLIFDPSPEVTEIYGKPTARNVQIWTEGGRSADWVLDGPRANGRGIERARKWLEQAPESAEPWFRESFPPMEWEHKPVKWMRPLVAWYRPSDGSFVWDWRTPGVARWGSTKSYNEIPIAFVEPLRVERELAALLDKAPLDPTHTAWEVRKILEQSQWLGRKLSEAEAQALLTPRRPREVPQLRRWLKELTTRNARLGQAVAAAIVPTRPPEVPRTYASTLGEGFERRYWNRLREMTEGSYRDKNAVDCTSPNLQQRCRENQLPDMARRYLAPHYEGLGLEVAFHAFHWVTDFDWFTGFALPRWWGGLELNLPRRSLADIRRDGHVNVIAVIPGEDRSEAVILADHYDTAFMDDLYEEKGLRHASKGADDNASGTAALMEAAQHLSKLPLKRDVWLVHLTGEEFPADCLGARALATDLVNGTPLIPGRKNPTIRGVFVLDMVSHHTDRDRDPKAPAVFQIAQGFGRQAAHLAALAFGATESWNAVVEPANEREKRQGKWQRTAGPQPPPTAPYLKMRGELRPGWHPASAFYNTDAIIFSDVGIPSVLFMENYDIGRKGYHDTLDTLGNIDLDYGTALSRIAIEATARAALE